jgi:hypothetical protein
VLFACAAIAGCSASVGPDGSSGDQSGDDAGPGNPGKGHDGGPPGVGSDDGGSTTSPDGGTMLPPPPMGPVDVKLPMPERQEWDTGVGYCGEESIQTIGLYYGAWISQGVVRSVAGQPVIFGNGGENVLSSLHFHYDVWDYASANNPEYQDFMVWMKGYLVRGIPTIFAEYVHDHSDPPDPDYDHLVPGIGIKTAAAESTTFDPTDLIYFNTNEQTSVGLAFGALSGDRSCSVDSYKGGCVPVQVDYGVAVTGIVDDGSATVPVHLTVASDHEPDPTSGQMPVPMKATVTVTGLTAGKQYTLLRYGDYTKVPTSGPPSAYLSSPADSKVPFTAMGTEWTHDDPQPFSSDTAVFYRCVPN